MMTSYAFIQNSLINEDSYILASLRSASAMRISVPIHAHEDYFARMYLLFQRTLLTGIFGGARTVGHDGS